MPFLLLFVALTFGSFRDALAVTLPSGLRPADVETLVSELGPAAATRTLRSAESYPAWPGIKLGIEVLALPTRDLQSLGNGDGSAPSVIPAPRFYLAKGIGNDFEIIANGMWPAKNSVTGWGLGVKWNAQSEEETWVAIAGYAAYTRVNGYDSAYLGHDLELGAILSKDYVRIKPFLVIGMLAAQGTIAPALAATPTQSSWQGAFHLALGTEIELPVNFTVQLDLMNFSPMGSVLIAKKF